MQKKSKITKKLSICLKILKNNHNKKITRVNMSQKSQSTFEWLLDLRLIESHAHKLWILMAELL